LTLDPGSRKNIPDPQHCHHDRIEDPDMIVCSFLKSALLTAESGVVARVLEPGSGEAPAERIQVNHNEGSLAGFGLDLWEKLRCLPKEKNTDLSFHWSKRVSKKTCIICFNKITIYPGFNENSWR
jgi:hypothetical protein